MKVKPLIIWLMVVTLVLSSVPWTEAQPKVFAHGSDNHGQEKQEKKSKKNKNVERLHEIKEKRTSHSKTFKNSDLTETTEMYSSPVFYQEESKGNWLEIDNTVSESIIDQTEKGKYKYKNKANKFSSYFASHANKEIFKIKQKNHWLSYSISGASNVEAKAKDNEIVYKNIFKDTDAKYRIGRKGIKEDFILHSKPDFNTITFDLKTNLEIEQKDNTFDFLDKKTNEVIWSFEPLFMRDSNDMESYKSTFEYVKSQGKNTLVLHLDEDFLNDKDTKYPVYLDPTVTVGGTSSTTTDAYVGEYYSHVNYGSDVELRTGYAPGVYSHRSFIKPGTAMPNLNGGLLTGATFKAYKYYEPASVDTTINIHKANASWAESTLKWENQPTFGGTYASNTLSKGEANGWYSWNVASLVDYWYTNPTAYHGLVMQASNENTTGSYRKFYASDYGTGSYSPRLEVNYSPKPTVPTGSATGNGANTGNGYVDLNWTSVAGATGYKVLIFNGKAYEEIDVGNVTAWSTKGKKLWPTASQIATGTYTLRKDGTGTEFSDDPRPVYQNSGGTYQSSKNYWFRIKAYNSLGETAQSDAFMPTIIDQTAPTKPGTPTIGNELNTQFRINWQASTDSLSGVQKYLLYMGTTSGGTNILNGEPVTSNTYTFPTPLDPRVTYYYYVKAVDNSGNSSPVSGIGQAKARLLQDASLQAVSIPDPMEAGGDYNVEITLKNEGIETWTSAQNFMLGSVNETDPFSKILRLPLGSTEVINKDQSKTFALKFNGGDKTGLFNTKWRMLKIGTGWFGDTLSRDVPVVDTKAPTGSIVINNGQEITNSPNVTLSLNATDNTSSGWMQRFKNETATYSTYEPFNTTKQWTLSEANGEKTVTAMFKDGSGNESVEASDSIKLDTNFPTAVISTPKELDYLNGTIEIKGTTKDEDLREYSLEYGIGDVPTSWYSILISDRVIEDGLLANWDTSSLTTGKYTIRLTVTDAAGNTTYEQKKVWIDQSNNQLGLEDFWGTESTASGFGSSDINLSNGNLILNYTDASVDGRQLDPSIGRTYNSQDINLGLLGQGWRLSIETAVNEEANGDVIYSDSDGSKHRFIKNTDNTYSAPKGIFKRLIKNTDGKFVITDLDPASISETYSDTGSISSISDKNGNKITFVYTDGKLTSMKDDVSREILFKYGTNNLIDEIILYTGNRVKYGFNEENLLNKVEFFDKNGVSYRVLTYRYNSLNKLTHAVDPNGNAVVYSYNGNRVINAASQHTSREAATGKNLAPVTLNESLIYDLAAKKVMLRVSGAADSQEIDYLFNDAGNIIETVTDPKGLAIREKSTYQDNLLKESIDGKGYKTSYTYDTLGNLLAKTEPTFTDVEGGTGTPITTYEYKAGTNLVVKETDALGRSVTYDYDTKGNRTLMIDSEGFKTTYDYDQYGNLLKETSERGALYGYLPNFSFEEGDTSFKNWNSTGTVTSDTTNKKSGIKSAKLTGTSAVTSEFVPVKKGKLPVRALYWMKGEGLTGTGIKGTLLFYDENKSKISETSSTPTTGSNDWKLFNLSASIPDNAAFISFRVDSALTAGSAFVDSVWVEEANIIEQSEYSTDGLYLVTSTDAYGKKMKYEYDAAGNKISETNELNQTALYNYDADRKVIEEIDRIGKKTVNKYDLNGNLLQVTNPLNQVTEFTYDENNRQTLIKNPEVTKTFYVGQTPQTPEKVVVTEVDEYNEFGQKVAEKDGNGNVSTFVYDKANRLITTTDPLKNKAVYVYDANDNKIKEEDWAYDVSTSTPHIKGTTLYNYDELNREISFTDSSGNPNSIVEKTKYDAVDNEIKTISGVGVTTEFQFDKNNESIYTKESSTPVTETWALYDGNGNLAISLDKQGASYNTHDANGNLLEVIDEEGKKTSYSYNAAGDKIKQVDATGTETTWEYDAEGQLTSEAVKIVNPDTNEVKHQITEYQYDAFGQVTKRTHKEKTNESTITSKEVSLEYDELGRLVKESGSAEGKLTETRFYFDNNGNTTHTWVYDETVAVPETYDPDKDGKYNTETISTYDANNRLLQESISHTGTVTTHSFVDKDNKEILKNALGDTEVFYNNNEDVSSIRTPNGDTFTYEYLVDDSISKINAPGVKTSLTYNGGTKVATMKGINGSGSSVVDLGYTYTDTEQIAQITDKGQVKKKYTYTANGYLETVEANGKKYKFSYDANGNMIRVDNLTSGKVKETYTYATGNRISQKKEYNDTTGTLIRTINYTFNANGALAKAQITEGSQTNTIDYTYNNDDQLIKIIKNINGTQTSILYEYDQDGNRLAKTVNGVHQHYHRDTNGEIFKVTTETANGSQTMFNVYKDADGNLLSFRYNDSLYYYQFNARGDVIAITDPAGTVIATYDYDEWGNITSITGNQEVANANPYRFVGKYGVIYDKDANTYLMGWRDYNPSTGRFIVPDEYEGEEDEPTSLNRYLYAEGDPVNNIDPDGHLPKWMQRGWKSTKKYSKKAYNFAAGDDIRKLRSKKSKWYQKAGAGASLASNFIPGVGAAKWGAKAGIKALKYGKKAKKIKKFPASSIKKTRKQKLKSKKTYKKTYSARSYTAKRTSKKPGGCNCFTVNTKVKTDNGEKDIQDVKIGDKVLAKDEDTGKQAYKDVEWLYERNVSEIYEIHVGEEVLQTTDEHPFWIIGEGWVEAKDLKAGDKLENQQGDTLIISKVVVKKKNTTVYNFKVKDYHTYFVSDLNIYTHNSCVFKPKQVDGKKVFQRSDIDWGKKDARGRTNRQRAKKGLAPLGRDGKSINLHHIGQRDDSSLVEVTASIHSKYKKVLHKYNGKSRINRKNFNSWRKDYWKTRAKE
ncbi:DNRLRE domain-containing protein [Fictibacillus nanhaiensis]|uniref:DNRLRE domain-containing protein n=1 Tax=Fictibacillus nanhaiensis TaxID=742169 RepID=A0ABS2ZPU1_9BACL|nr:DNRLRE domain-containing protein [Fictibacillus nanhaiensis]